MGESNSGGIAANTDATAQELLETDRVKIWDNVNNDGFENLDIGTNNLLEHTGLEAYVNTGHGWELQLANRAKQNAFKLPTIYLCKCGQGGSKINQWDLTDSYYTTFVSRTNGAKSAMELLNKTYKTYVYFSLGINDSNAGTNPVTWYNSVINLFERVRTQLNNPLIFGTLIPDRNANDAAINDKINDLDSNLSYFTKIQTSDASERDQSHWDYEGMKLIADRMIDLTLADFL